MFHHLTKHHDRSVENRCKNAINYGEGPGPYLLGASSPENVRKLCEESCEEHRSGRFDPGDEGSHSGGEEMCKRDAM